MFDLSTAPAMATHLGFTTFAELVQSKGLINTSKALQMSHRTVPVRVSKPGTFTLSELLRLAELTEMDLGKLVTKLAQQVGDSAQNPPVKERRGASVELGNNALVIRMKNPETMSHDELAMLAKLSGSTLSDLTSQVAAQKARKAGEPTTIAELIHNIGGRYETADALGMSPNTLAARMKKPEGFTLADLLAVAKVANTDLVKVTQLAQYQLQNRIDPPAPVVGRPPLNH